MLNLNHIFRMLKKVTVFGAGALWRPYLSYYWSWRDDESCMSMHLTCLDAESKSWLQVLEEVKVFFFSRCHLKPCLKLLLVLSSSNRVLCYTSLHSTGLDAESEPFFFFFFWRRLRFLNRFKFLEQAPFDSRHFVMIGPIFTTLRWMI